MTDHEVVIIGAGAAGIAAARTLSSYGIDHLVLEADSRVGGRAWTDESQLGVPFDLGASFIHAVDAGNPWADIALATGAKISPDPRRRSALSAEGQNDPDGAIAYLARRGQAFDIVEDHASAGDRPLPADLGLSGAWSAPACMAIGPWLAGTDNTQLGPADWMACHSGEDWLLPQGYGRLVESQAAGINVKLNTKIECIAVSGGNVEITTTKGSLTAQHLILTVSIGVLQAEMIQLEPRLPQETLNAIDGLLMGNLVKIGIELLSDLPPFDHSHYVQLDDPDPLLPLYYVRPGDAPILMAFMGGSAVNDLAKDGASALIDAAIRPLAKRLGSATTRRVFGRALATAWLENPLTLGTYSNGKPGCGDARRRLREPWFERVFYAGEANAPDGWQGTVAGAHLAGRNAAIRIAEQHKK